MTFIERKKLSQTHTVQKKRFSSKNQCETQLTHCPHNWAVRGFGCTNALCLRACWPSANYLLADLPELILLWTAFSCSRLFDFCFPWTRECCQMSTEIKKEPSGQSAQLSSMAQNMYRVGGKHYIQSIIESLILNQFQITSILRTFHRLRTI